jgi:hypothetical protein
MIDPVVFWRGTRVVDGRRASPYVKTVWGPSGDLSVFCDGEIVGAYAPSFWSGVPLRDPFAARVHMLRRVFSYAPSHVGRGTCPETDTPATAIALAATFGRALYLARDVPGRAPIRTARRLGVKLRVDLTIA